MSEIRGLPGPTWISVVPKKEGLIDWALSIRRAFLTDWNVMRAYVDAIAGRMTTVLTGMSSSLLAGVVTVTAGDYQILGTSYTFAGDTIALDAPDAVLSRFDVVYIGVSGILQKSTGTAAVQPVIPSINYQLNVQLAVVYVSTPASWIAG